MNLDQTHQVLEPIATRAFDYGDFVLDCVCIHAGWIWHRCSHRLFVSLLLEYEWTDRLSRGANAR